MHKQTTWLVVGSTALVIFLILMGGVLTDAAWLQLFDTHFQTLLAHFDSANRTFTLKEVSLLGSPAVNLAIAAALAGCCWMIHDRFNAIWIICAEVGANGIAFVAKELVRRPRPTGQLVPDTGFSFPSGHTISTATLVLIVIFVLVPYFKDQEAQLAISLLSVIWLAVIAFARVYLRDHYPSDVIGAILLALVWWEIMRVSYLYLVAPRLHQPQLEEEVH
ncbi:phosphatase PAP2 family protein [Secundilactobacillus collinoides]|uniref:Phosphatidic acid phosphatase type 2/haloperoxidase domain-containing protein n=1 Tax=Secundilactobacillus collinoides TaxID=33960 RepID=A0A166FWL7_SECCO|nr:phosphatase PAP2 family protein [Secundilactobacillus collinoides]KZL35895.1 hypothetical protein TY91_14920 [Secundilactobacillus collinoides]